MVELTNVQGLSFYGYKSYIDVKDVNLDPLCNFNVIIGKNNTGKTSFIDIIDVLINPKKLSEKPYENTIINLAITLDEENIINALNNEFTHSFKFTFPNYLTYAKQYVGIPIILTWQNAKTTSFVFRDADDDYNKRELWKQVANHYFNCFSSYCLLRINAERDIKPEAENFDLNLSSNGEGASNLVRAFINQSEYKEEIIEGTLLQELNKIMGSDAHFTRIQIQQIKSKEHPLWEIFLEEKDVGRFALSKSGSGLKTIILVLLNLLVTRSLDKYKGKKFAYAFEELENNLHPALQRRLFEYLYNFSIINQTPIFLTTHSHIAIDMFCSKYDAQVLHVTKQEHTSSIKKVDNTLDKIKILDDLAVKASDLFQSNGIIWVEGPSDRIYINKWLSIFCNSRYQEGRDFQYLYYGGKLLSHYSADELKNKINILTTNHNSAIVMDSDKKNRNMRLNDTKKRIISEFENKKLFCWVTKGKEIENYIPLDAINKMYPNTPKKHQCGTFDLFPNYIKQICPNFADTKVRFATQIIQYITAKNSEDMLDLKEQIEKLYKQIEQWNSNN